MYSKTSKRFTQRLIFINIVTVILFVITGLRYWYLQVVKGQEYLRVSKENTLRVISLPAKRGKILAKGGEILADYSIGYNIMLDRNRIHKNRIPEIAEFLNMSEQELSDILKRYRHIPVFTPIPIKENITFSEVSKFEAVKKDFPELYTGTEPFRYYPYRGLFAHVIGYTGEPTLKELKNMDEMQKIGKSGLEKTYNSTLTGKNGLKKIIVDSRSHYIDTQLINNPVHGRDIQTSLNLELQKNIQTMMGEYRGTVIVMDIHTGSVYAMYSNPTFNPNLLTNRFNNSMWDEVRHAKNNPLLNRAIQGKYSPGSIFKLLMMISALDSGVFSSRKYSCEGVFQYGEQSFRCWYEEGHGALNMKDAIAFSCNVYFYNLALNLGIERILDTGNKFRFCQKTGIDIPGEVKGLFPDPAWKKQRTGYSWYPGDSINTSIGQGYLLVTPVQLAVFIAAIANDGKLVSPHFAIDSNLSFSTQTIDIPENTFRKVRQAMRKVVSTGTAVSMGMEGISAAGKTGTAQTISHSEDKGTENAWFAGFYPYKNPKIAVIVLAEKGGHGSDTAVPIATEIFKFYKNNPGEY